MGTQTKTLAEQVADGIMNLIQETPYKAGDKLPTEKDLCESTGAGRNTVREALKILASRNVLEIRQGAGTFVSEKQGIPDDPLGFSMVNDHVKLTKDLLQVRIMLEPQIAALAAQCAKENEIKELEEILEEMEAAMKKREDYSELDTKFHTKIAQCTHNIVMENLLPVICGTAFILVAQAFLRGLFTFSINLDDAAGTEIHICVDKDFQAVGLIL